MDEAAFFLLRIWLGHIAIAVFLCIPIIFLGRKRAHWQRWEVVAFALPFWTWGILMLIGGDGKTLANLQEAVVITFAIPMAASIRVAIGGRKSLLRYSVLILLFLCAVSAGLYFFVPGLPE